MNRTIDVDKQIEFWPAEEVRSLMEAFKVAADNRNLEALLWCASHLQMLYALAEEGDLERGQEQIAALFAMAYHERLAPPPALIAGIVRPDTGEGGGAPRIGNRSDALALLDGMIDFIERGNAAISPQFRGKENAIGSDGYYWPRLEAVRDAIGREVI